MPATGPERVPIGKGAMTPFLAQILRQINDAAARGSQGDPAKAIKIRDDLLEQIARPVLEGAISKATRDMAQSAATGGAMAHAAARERMGQLRLKTNEMTSEAVSQMRVASAVIAAGATLGAKYMELKPSNPNDVPIHKGPFGEAEKPPEAAMGTGPGLKSVLAKPSRLLDSSPDASMLLTPSETLTVPPSAPTPRLSEGMGLRYRPPMLGLPPAADETSSVIGGGQ